MCCGSRRSAWRAASPSPKAATASPPVRQDLPGRPAAGVGSPALMSAQSGFPSVDLHYSEATEFRVRGPVTGRRYVFSGFSARSGCGRQRCGHPHAQQLISPNRGARFVARLVAKGLMVASGLEQMWGAESAGNAMRVPVTEVLRIEIRFSRVKEPARPHFSSTGCLRGVGLIVVPFRRQSVLHIFSNLLDEEAECFTKRDRCLKTNAVRPLPIPRH